MLNPDQQLAVNAEGHTMVVAIPGSGKTEVSVRYAERILSSSPSAAIAMLTFTDAAAKNLKKRLDKNLPKEQAIRAYPSTFHSMAVQMWRSAYSYKRIIMGGGQYVFVERARTASGYAGDIDAAFSAIERLGQLLEIKKADASRVELDLFKQYQKILHKEHCVDLNQISREVILGLRDGSVKPLSQTLGLTHICADEFQDSDDLQYLFLYEHAIRGCTIFTVGDDDQSIYGWRRANGVANFKNLQADLQAKAYSLKICYRCPPAVLKVADSLISHNEDRIPKKLQSHLDVGGHVDVIGLNDEDAQIEHIGRELQHDPDGWAILARTNKELDTIEGGLAAFNLNIKRLGGKSYFDNPDVIAYIKMMYMFTHNESRYLPDFLGYMREEEDIIDDVKELIKHRRPFHQLVDHLYENVASSYTANIIEMHRNREWPETKNKEPNSRIQTKLLDFVVLARNQNSSGIMGSVADLLTRNASQMGSLRFAVNVLHERISGISSKADTKVVKNQVVLATLHGAKGLEFPKVAIMSCQDERIPQPDKDGLGEAHWEEERRLFYVGITRAEEILRLYFFKPNLTFLREAMPDRVDAALDAQERLNQPSEDGQAKMMELRAALN